MTLLFESYCNARPSKPLPLFFIRSTNLRFTLASINIVNHSIQPIRLLAQQRRSFTPLPTNAPTQADTVATGLNPWIIVLPKTTKQMTSHTK